MLLFFQIISRVLSFFILITASPVLLLIGLIIYIENREFPVFIQKRGITLNNSCFNIYKFRTIRTQTPKTSSGSFLYKPGMEFYISPFSAFLRKTGLDETLQLLNIIKGEMNFIGPRPLSLDDLEIMMRDFPGLYSIREKINIKPGITGLWQIFGDRDLGIKNIIENDLHYYKNKSFKLDTKILFFTLIVMIKGNHSDSIINTKKNLNTRLINNAMGYEGKS